MKTKFVLKAKNLNKKWLEAIKSLYGKQEIIITISTEEDELLDFAAFDTDDDWWETEEDEWDLLNISNEEKEEEEEKEEAPTAEETPVTNARTPRAKKIEPIAEIVPTKKQSKSKTKKTTGAPVEKKTRGPYKKTLERLAKLDEKE